MSRSKDRVPLAIVDPKSWAPMYKGTYEIHKIMPYLVKTDIYLYICKWNYDKVDAKKLK